MIDISKLMKAMFYRFAFWCIIGIPVIIIYLLTTDETLKMIMAINVSLYVTLLVLFLLLPYYSLEVR